MKTSKMNPLLGTLALALILVKGMPAEVRKFVAGWRGLADSR